MSFTRRQPGLEITLTWRLRTSWSALPLLRRVARHVAAAEGFRTGRLSVVVVGSRGMTTLHARYLGQAGPTDVLAFDLGCDAKAGVLDGEIIICADIARRQAKQTLRQLRPRPTLSASSLQCAARNELALYLAHGLLHLTGYDDHRPAEFRRMHAREDELLAQLGLGPVFTRGDL